MKNLFTLVEVTMAIAVIAIGMCGILALFPIGLQATKDAIGDNYSSSIAEQFLHLTKTQCDEYEGNGTIQDGWGEWITDDPNKLNDVNIHPISLSSPSFVALDYNKVLKGDGVFGDSDLDGYDDIGVYSDSDGVDMNGVFYTEARTGDIMDWNGVIYLWREPIKYYNEDNEFVDMPYAFATRLCVEISWPYEIPYAQRRKRVYTFEIFNPNERAGY